MGPCPLDTEFVLGFSGGDLVVGQGVDAGVDADGDGGADALVCGHLPEKLQFGFRFHVDLKNPGVQRRRQFLAGLADAGKDDARSRNARRQGALEFATGNHVGAGAEPGEDANDGDVGIGFNRIANGCIDIGEGIGENPVVPLDGGLGITIKRRSRFLGDTDQGDVLGAQPAVPVDEMIHDPAIPAVRYWVG